eukprot:TRINITY_DN2581_c0_g1_i5.p1 TRINITY_DN2581_c0_g1~~TRINITY_DN2581_c0_g1_i5.p1  ORF type:complete len:566 (+),score=81.38 TRINITY_DN2581_c0_g1_i5:573-2270(+)
MDNTVGSWEWTKEFGCEEWLQNAGFHVSTKIVQLASDGLWQELLSYLKRETGKHTPKNLLWQVTLLSVCTVAPQKTARTIPDPPQRDTIYDLDLTGSGLGRNCKIYARNEVVQLWQNLDHKIHMVTGPPGTGKSTAVWWWACTVSKPVIWVHFFKTQVPLVSLIKFDSVEWYFVDAEKVITAIIALQVRTQCQVVVLDGCTCSQENVMSHFRTKVNADASLTLVIVSSGQVKPIPAEEGTNVTEHHVESWTLQEFEAACAHPQFVSSVKPLLVQAEQPLDIDESTIAMLLEEKYWLVGGSARYMFALNYITAKKAIDDAFSTAISITPQMISGPGTNSSAMINRLYGYNRKTGWYLASQYIVSHIIQQGSVELLTALTAAAKSFNIPALDGYALQIEFEVRLKTHIANHIIVYNNNGQELQWDVGNLHYFERVTELNQEAIQPGDWLIPRLRNQGGYDAVQITASTLRFILLTRASTHSIKLAYITTLQKILNVQGHLQLPIEVVIVVPMGHDFHPGLITGEIQCMKEGKMTRWTLADLQTVYLDRVTKQSTDDTPKPPKILRTQ